MFKLDQFTVDQGACRHFNGAILQATLDSRRRPQDDPGTRHDVAPDGAMDLDDLGGDRTLDERVGPQYESRSLAFRPPHAAGDPPFQLHATGEDDVAFDPGTGADQRLDAGVVPVISLEHKCPQAFSTVQRKVCRIGLAPLRAGCSSTVVRAGVNPGGSLMSCSSVST